MSEKIKLFSRKRPFVERIKVVILFFSTDIWRLAEGELSRNKRIYIRLAKKLILSARGFINNDLMLKAAALTFYTIMAIVPILALIVVIGRSFGFQDAIDSFITDAFSSQQELIPFLTDFINNYINQAHGGIFVGVGVAVLLWSVVNMFRHIENNFNAIWNVKKSRALAYQFATYLSLIILVPVFIGLSSGISIYINQRVGSALMAFASPLNHFLWQLLPYLFYWMLFTAVYLIVPNTRVRFPHALLAGIVAGTGFMLFQHFYVSGQINLSRYNTVYGSFAAIPLLLFWLQISWVIVLYGAELSFVSQNLRQYAFERETGNISRRYKDTVTLMIMKIIIDRFAQNQSAVSAEVLADKYNIPIRLANDLIRLLVDVKMIVETASKPHEEKFYIPAFDINRMTVGMLYERIENHGSDNLNIDADGVLSRIHPVIDALKTDLSETTTQILIKDL
jgi:membrane protein